MTNPGRILMAAVLGGALLVGCGGATEDVQFPGTTAIPVPTEASAEGGSIGEIAVQGMDDAAVVVCDSERRTLEVATEAFTAMNGRPPVDAAELVGDWIRDMPVGHVVTPRGAVRPVVDGPCA